jgi:hypothetical protein
MKSREFRVQMPPDVAPEQYAAVVHAVVSLLNSVGLVSQSTIWIDHVATDIDLRQASDRFSDE